MPHIIVIADQAADNGEEPIMFRERVTVSDFESSHFGRQLVERLGWAVGDADALDRRSGRTAERRRTRQRVIDNAQREMAGISRRAVRPVS
jgi:hypothetical protein